MEHKTRNVYNIIIFSALEFFECENVSIKHVLALNWETTEMFLAYNRIISCHKPMQACLVGVPWYPSWHLQWYDPCVLTQSPFTHGLLTHSSTSEGRKQMYKRPLTLLINNVC